MPVVFFQRMKLNKEKGKKGKGWSGNKGRNGGICVINTVLTLLSVMTLCSDEVDVFCDLFSSTLKQWSSKND